MRKHLTCLVALTFACGGSKSRGGGDTTDSGATADATIGRTDAAGQDGGGAGSVDFTSPGPHSVESSTDTLELEDCALPYTLYAPNGAGPHPLVVLGHGFTRGQEQMAGLAEHIASYGARVATPDYCHLSAIDTDHPQNGLDAVSLAEHLAGGAGVLYAGHSAGGLAALLAAVEDPAAVAVLGLDLVDSDSLGAGAIEELEVPLFGLTGEPSSCNANGNGDPLYSGGERWAARVVGANHCDFESPTGFGCTAICGQQTGAPTTIHALAAAFVAWKLGLQPAGEAWVTDGGAKWEALASEGTIAPL